MLLLPLNYLALGVPNARYEIYESLARHIMGNPEVVFTGDSITRGGGIWAFRIHRYDFKVSNIAKGGFDTDNVKAITLRELDKRPKRLFIMSGRNDMAASYKNGNAKACIGMYREILNYAVHKGTRVYVTSTLYRADEQNPNIVDELNIFLREWCATNQQVYIDLNARLSEHGKLRQEFTTDGCHINEGAYRIWAGMIRSLL